MSIFYSSLFLNADNDPEFWDDQLREMEPNQVLERVNNEIQSSERHIKKQEPKSKSSKNDILANFFR
ncbi:hypothetical protein TVAG_191370 [Trichomonas vaginalis G3]|uniref:Uncharacterized protein n=1 Tax=Trichomonas vaginalis (strain ATCC PRA-98 / G3) TaxID=412133 RepID=A2EQJ3_TRIV3|nr:hypothetical protein TVAGG3_0976340 [Trichomonas vaginalis G3]EAY05040.1 hypothetical protein TVAG_191370 [Trichomonas vaginalis G3]KAI5488957.1 hypothetical protein TVAGG3_0976340 [Trichomonas vaginalis G3]|eukprot:XP_001317263.1 hypothetical protein [Trichomonas vaginalis G3]